MRVCSPRSLPDVRWARERRGVLRPPLASAEGERSDPNPDNVHYMSNNLIPFLQLLFRHTRRPPSHGRNAWETLPNSRSITIRPDIYVAKSGTMYGQRWYLLAQVSCPPVQDDGRLR